VLLDGISGFISLEREGYFSLQTLSQILTDLLGFSRGGDACFEQVPDLLLDALVQVVLEAVNCSLFQLDLLGEQCAAARARIVILFERLLGLDDAQNDLQLTLICFYANLLQLLY